MKFKDYLQEEYETSLKPEHYKHKVEETPIFVNPSKKELLECGDYIRFLINFPDRKIYCWNGNQLVHWEVAKYLQKKGEISIKSEEVLNEISFWKNYCVGMGRFTAGKIYPTSLSDYFPGIIYDIADTADEITWSWWVKEPSWLKTYFTSSLVEAMKKFYSDQLSLLDNDLDEEYVTSFDAKDISLRFDGGYTEIFKNPSKKELTQLSKIDDSAVRYFIDFDTGDIYVWKASTVHYFVQQQLSREGHTLRNFYQGVGIIKAGKIYEVDSDNPLWDVPIVLINKIEQERPPTDNEMTIISKRIVTL
jgi:hypothetical protein